MNRQQYLNDMLVSNGYVMKSLNDDTERIEKAYFKSQEDMLNDELDYLEYKNNLKRKMIDAWRG